MAKSTIDSRRRALIGAGLTALTPFAALAALTPTPRQTAGPFYPVELPLDDDNNLTMVRGQTQPAEGRIVDLTGRVIDTSGKEMKHMRIEIWQCDARGIYHHPGDRRRGTQRDEKFQGHGHTITDNQGRYRFRTIHPVPYPGRTPHIHVAVFLPNSRPFVSQIYVEGEPRNSHDFLYQQIPVEKRHLVMMDFATENPEGIPTGNFDLILVQKSY